PLARRGAPVRVTVRLRVPGLRDRPRSTLAREPRRARTVSDARRDAADGVPRPFSRREGAVGILLRLLALHPRLGVEVGGGGRNRARDRRAVGTVEFDGP